MPLVFIIQDPLYTILSVAFAANGIKLFLFLRPFKVVFGCQEVANSDGEVFARPEV